MTHERMKWFARLEIGDELAIRGDSPSLLAMPYYVLKVHRLTISSLFAHGGPNNREFRFRRKDARLVGAGHYTQCFPVPVSPSVRISLAEHELRDWIKYRAEHELLKLTQAQQCVLRALVLRMAADPAVHS